MTLLRFASIPGAVLLMGAAAVLLPPPSVTVSERASWRVVSSNGIPDHDTGRFPNRRNPNRIEEQDHRFRMPLEPVASPWVRELGMHPFGVATNGVPFDPGAAEWYRDDPSSGWRYEPLSGGRDVGLDHHHAHVQPGGTYHYHGLPTGLLRRNLGKEPVVLVGWAADGYPIYGPFGYMDPADPASEPMLLASSWRLKEGRRPGGDQPSGRYDGTFVQDYEYVSGAGNLDECNGRTAATPEFPEGTYHYVLTEGWPVIPRCFKGTPDPSFLRHGPRPRRRAPPRRGHAHR